MQPGDVDVLYVLSNGFASRMIMHSSLLPQLHERGLKVAVMAPDAERPDFARLCERHGVMAVTPPRVGNLFLVHYAQTRRYLFEDYEANAALRSKHLYEVHEPGGNPLRRVRPIIGKAINRVTLRSQALRNVLIQAEHGLFRHGEMRSILARVAPAALVTTYPVAWLEAFAIAEANRLGIPTIGQLLSWDNISCKGRFPASPSHYISWGPIMTEEIGSYYGVDASRIAETGVAHFDAHAEPVDRAQLRSHLVALGLDPDAPYLFFGMSAVFFAPHEIDIVAWLAEAVRRGDFGERMQLLVRPHPQNIRGSMADPTTLGKLQAITGPRVALDVPKVLTDKLDFDEADLPRLAALLSGAAVTLNSGSTLSIDALLHRRPVVLTLFDADRRLPWYRSARRIEEFPHLQKLTAYGGVSIARSFDDLHRHVRAYLDEPGLHEQERLDTVRAECGPSDGHACTRIADHIARFVAERRS